MILILTTPTPFPYTTLFRSRGGERGRNRTGVCERMGDPMRRMMHLGICLVIAAAAVACGREPAEPEAEPPTLDVRSEEHTSELQSPCNIVCRLLLEKRNVKN